MDSSREARFSKIPTKRSSVASHIPLEVITEILAKLPVKSLLKFRAVCMSWCSLISSRQFVRKHLSRNITSTPKRLIHLRSNDLTFYSLHDSVLVEESSSIEFPLTQNYNLYCGINKMLPVLPSSAVMNLMIMGYCDGLLCVKAYTSCTSLIFLWNPSIRDSKLLPYTLGVIQNYHNITCCGFGYDFNRDNYKVLIVVPPVVSSNNSRDSSFKSMIYTLRTNSWRRIQDFPFNDIYFEGADMSATLVSGALHWMVRNREGGMDSWQIICFDLTTETYMEVVKPDYYRVNQFPGVGIGASNTDCLCFLAYNRAGQTYEFWVMKEYGVKESWTLSAKISYLYGLRPVTWFTENGEILFIHIDGKLTIYNVNYNSVTYLHQIPNGYSSTRGDVYVESLVSPNAYSDDGANDISSFNIHVGGMRRVLRNA
ncbi:F-box/kelch-repeat protein At3g06240-like [Argentina anserina]|uniref:F-box/kelch-repeat protein At3g06240-like n=1 Tax=Argentina anserina TaxID=57926 RepID=UPI0021768CFC|nr:F-box/kelch-repeat protein At3g06240-like [Potentilla anserina]